MGVLIEFYHPTLKQKASASHGPDGPHACVINHGESGKDTPDYHLCECGLEWGASTGPQEQLSPAELLSGLLQNAATMRDVLVITRDATGHCGLISNLGGVADCVLLIEQTKLQMLKVVETEPKGIA